jgi:two-component system, NarL family, sensor histidine kinase UhpB
MAQKLRLLLVEDSPQDAELLLIALRRAGFTADARRVDTEARYLAELNGQLDLILSDYELPQFNGLRALDLLKERGLDVPFIIVSGAIGEDTAVVAMKHGAADYLLKDRLARLGPSVSHALEQARLRRERQAANDALVRAEAKYHSIFENTMEGIFQTTPDGRFLTVNPAMAHILGFASPEELMRERAHIPRQDDLSPERRQDFERLMAALGHVAGFEYELKRHDGARVWVSENARAIRDAAGGVAYYEGTLSDITERREAEDRLKQANERYRALAARVEAVREQERTAIAREIHDVLAQELTRLKLDLTWLAKHVDRPERDRPGPAIGDRLASALAQTDTAITTVQRIATELRPVVLDSLGLPAAVEWQVEDFARRTGLSCRATVPSGEFAIDRERATALFRILQESLTNIARHAQAAAVEVSLADDGAGVTLLVHDDGRGITREEIGDHRSIGLIGMGERAQAFGGVARVAGRPGGGTTVTVRLPREHPPAG